MSKEEIRKKASLSWTLKDYGELKDEPPECLNCGLTEGESMEENDVREWIREEIQCLSIMKEEFPKKFEENYRYFILDLEYLNSLGKIDKEEYKLLIKDKEVFNFGRK